MKIPERSSVTIEMTDVVITISSQSENRAPGDLFRNSGEPFSRAEAASGKVQSSSDQVPGTLDAELSPKVRSTKSQADPTLQNWEKPSQLAAKVVWFCVQVWWRTMKFLLWNLLCFFLGMMWALLRRKV